MPFLSKSQSKWAFTPAGMKALGGPDKVKEWADSTDYSSLPEKKAPKRGALGVTMVKRKAGTNG